MDDASKPTDGQPATPPREAWRIEIEQRIDEAADILAETLIDMWRAKTRAELDGRPLPTEDEPQPLIRPEPELGPPRREFAVLENLRSKFVARMLTQARFPASELALEPDNGKRYRVVLHYGGRLVGVTVLDEFGDVAVLRAIGVLQAYRRQGHGRALGAHVVRHAFTSGIRRVYCVARTPWFVEEVGFEHRERAALPEDARSLPGIVDASPSLLVFELTPTATGHRAPRRMFPRSALELLKKTANEPKAKRRRRTTGAQVKRKRHDQAMGDVTRKHRPLREGHNAVGSPCPACKVPFKEGDVTTLVLLGPGPNEQSREQARAGRPYNGVAVLLHWSCATGKER